MYLKKQADNFQSTKLVLTIFWKVFDNGVQDAIILMKKFKNWQKKLRSTGVGAGEKNSKRLRLWLQSPQKARLHNTDMKKDYFLVFFFN